MEKFNLLPTDPRFTDLTQDQMHFIIHQMNIDAEEREQASNPDPSPNSDPNYDEDNPDSDQDRFRDDSFDKDWDEEENEEWEEV